MTTATKIIKNIPFGRPCITEEDRQAVLEVLNHNILTHGPQGKAFEAEFASYLGEEAHCVAVSSCMAALHLAYLQLGIGPGDEVIVPAQTHTATVHAVEWVGAKPVFVDCALSTGNVTAAAISAAITPKTKAIGVVHFVGIPCDMPALMKVAEKHHLKVIEDCALALGARYQNKHVGLYGDAGCFSFYPVKHMTTGEGGMLVTRHAEVARGVEKLHAFGIERSTDKKRPGVYDIVQLGLNYRMSELQAALGRTQLRRIPASLSQREKNFEAISDSLKDIDDIRILNSETPMGKNSHYCLVAVLGKRLRTRRDEIVLQLNASGIGTSIYYPHPVPRMSYYRNKYGYDSSKYSGAIEISDHSIALPVGQHVTIDDAEYIAKNLKRIIKEI